MGRYENHVSVFFVAIASWDRIRNSLA
jgi:hypothetical protein